MKLAIYSITAFLLSLLHQTVVLEKFALADSTFRFSPEIPLCLDDPCKDKTKLKLTDASWQEIKLLFNSPLSTDKDEQDNIATAIALIEKDIYQTLASMQADGSHAEDLHSNNSSRNHLKNMRQYIMLLLDQRLITHHLLRKTITTDNWLGYKKKALLLQSQNNSVLYILQRHTQFAVAPIISPYKKQKKTKFSQPIVESIDDNADFE